LPFLRSRITIRNNRHHHATSKSLLTRFLIVLRRHADCIPEAAS
jgi:hypothetical protein